MGSITSREPYSNMGTRGLPTPQPLPALPLLGVFALAGPGYSEVLPPQRVPY